MMFCGLLLYQSWALDAGLFLGGAGGFARTAARAASRLWSAPGAPFTPARIESPAGTILEKARILRCGLLEGVDTLDPPLVFN